MSTTPQKRIGSLLVANGLITRAHLHEALQIQEERGGKLVEILIGLGYVMPQHFLKFLARQPGIASIEITRYGVTQGLIDLVPRDFAVKHEIFPLDRMGNLLTVGMVCPLDTRTIEELETLTGLRIKPLLVSANDLRQSIERHYEEPEPDAPYTPKNVPQEAELRLAGTALLIRQLDDLPALPSTIQRIQNAMSDVEVHLGEIARLISADPPLAAKILAVANSPAYGFPNRVASVELAVSLLGLRETYHIVLSVSVADLFNALSRFDYMDFWSHSALRAALAKAFARYTGHGKNASVFTAGLLADVGRVALAEVAPHHYQPMAQRRDGTNLVLEEEKALGIGHPEAGYILVETWGLPEDLADAIRFHHTPAQATTGMAGAMCIAAADAYAALPESNRSHAEAVAHVCGPYLERLGEVGKPSADLLADLQAVLSEGALLGYHQEDGSNDPSISGDSNDTHG